MMTTPTPRSKTTPMTLPKTQTTSFEPQKNTFCGPRMDTQACIDAAVTAIQTATPLVPEVGVILGSGLGAFADALSDATTLSYAAIPHFCLPHVEGHKGQLIIGRCQGVACAVLSGRLHYYEGHELPQVTFAIRVLQALGVKRLLVTNSAGGLNESFVPGDLMVISDHINMTGQNPLRGPHQSVLGVRFLDMTQAYSLEGQAAWHRAASRVGLKLQAGIYMGLTGPCYETPAEVRMLQRLGGDAVGMSTVAEVIVARHVQLEVAALSVITNKAAGLGHAALSHHEVTDIAQKVRLKLRLLLEQMVASWR